MIVGMKSKERLRRRSAIARATTIVEHIFREQRELARAARKMPRPVPWEWARPRLLPLLAGPAMDDPELPVVRAVAGPGCAVEFGMDLGGVFLTVDALVAERWETSPEQLRDVALANLRGRTEELSPKSLRTGTFSGRMVRMLRGPEGYAASLVLLTDELMRVFGGHDQILAAPSRSFLVSFPIDTPTSVVAYTVVDLEMGESLPLMFDPFVLMDGVVHWQPRESVAFDDDFDRNA